MKNHPSPATSARLVRLVCSLSFVALVACDPDPSAPSGSATGEPLPEAGGGGSGGASSSAAQGPSTAGVTTGGQPAPVKTVLLIPGTAITGDYFDQMAERLSADGFSPIVYESPDLMTASLADEAAAIGVEVQKVLAATGESRVHIVAECDGGVATRYYVTHLGGDAFVEEVVTFVSAHHGTWLSPVGSWVTGWQALSDIQPDSAFMSDLNSTPLPSGLRFTSIYTCNDEVMLPYETSVVEGATNVLFCDHFLMHLDGFWDDTVYGRIRSTLRGEGDTAPNSY